MQPMKTLINFILLFVFSINVLSSQNNSSSTTPSLLYGNVFNQDGENLIGATVVWDGTTIATITDMNGDFWLPKMDTTAFLEISYVGYDAVFIEMFPHEDTAYIKIEGVTELQTIEVAGQRSDVFTSTLDPINMENISACELKKAACCNLAESFETSGSVDVMKADAVTSTTEILMLGLRGIYSQLLIEKRPAYTGLGYPFALENIPGTWVSGIQVSKGASTVQNGPQSITGQINIELVKPWQDKPLYVNLFGSTTERGEANIHWNKNWTEKLSTGVILHGSTTRGEFDKNGDTFLDQQTKQSLNGLFRSFYRTDNFSTQLNLQVINDEREGGQLLPKNQPDPATYYRSKLQNKRVDLFGKFGYFGFDRPATSIGFIYNASWQDMDNVFGQNAHKGDQKRLYANLLFSTFLVSTAHTLNAGASFEFDDYDEFLNMADFSRKEVMPGAYAEYVYNNPGSGFGVIAGVRADHHNNFGAFITPRINVKYNFTENSIVRLSAGRGVRSAQVLAENLPILATNTEVEVLEKLQMEDAWNLGLNFTQSFNLFGRNASFVADLYRTHFNNQIIVDMESQHGSMLIYNLDGKSYANSMLLLGSWSAFKGFEMKVAYKLNDVKTAYNPPTYFTKSGAIERPLTARHRGLVTLNYETKDEKWMFNTNIQFTGKQRFMDDKHLPPNYTNRSEFIGDAPAYGLLNAQVTRRFKQLEIYVGGENLTNFTQKNAIVDWENPFGEYFNALQVWGPLVGARGYVGVRWWIE